MSLAYTDAVWATAQAKGTALLVLLAYAHAADDDGRAWLSLPSIARACRIACDARAWRIVQGLVKSGALERVGPHPDPRYRGATVYRLTCLPPARAQSARAQGVDSVSALESATPCAGAVCAISPDPLRGRRPTLLEIPLEEERERQAMPHGLNAHDGEATPTPSDGQGGSQEELSEGKACRIEEGQQMIRDALRRKTVSVGNSDHWAGWLNLARDVDARSAKDAAWILVWMIEKSRACGEAVKYPSHCVAQILPARAALAERMQSTTRRTA